MRMILWRHPVRCLLLAGSLVVAVWAVMRLVSPVDGSVMIRARDRQENFGMVNGIGEVVIPFVWDRLYEFDAEGMAILHCNDPCIRWRMTTTPGWWKRGKVGPDRKCPPWKRVPESRCEWISAHPRQAFFHCGIAVGKGAGVAGNGGEPGPAGL